MTVPVRGVLLLAIILLAEIATARAEVFSCLVLRVIDGDTFHCASGVKVRVDGINAPEAGDDLGPVSRDALTVILSGATVMCQPTGTTYDRIAAICYLDGQDIGAMMVEQAMARDCPRFSGGRYAALEDERHERLPYAPFCRP